MPDFAERIVGMRADGPDKFAPVYSNYDELKQYPPGRHRAGRGLRKACQVDANLWGRHALSPRLLATIESNVVQRVAERSLEALYETL